MLRASDEVIEAVLELLADGLSLTAACASERRFPAPKTIRRWANESDEHWAMYARARDLGYHGLVDEILDIADDASADPQRSRLQVDTRKWVLSKVLPRTYGEVSVLDVPAIQAPKVEPMVITRLVVDPQDLDG